MKDSTTEATYASVGKQIDIFAKEAPKRATEIVLALLEVAGKDGDITSPAGTRFSVVSLASSAFSA